MGDENVAAIDELDRATALKILAGLSDGVIYEDVARRVALVNAAFSEMFPELGTPGELEGVSVEQLHARLSWQLGAPEAFVAASERLYLQRARTHADLVLAKDGRRFERDGFPLFADGRHLGHVWLYRETAQDDSVPPRSAARMDGAFLARFSHELRNPLTAVLGAAQLLSSSDTSEDQREALEAILTGGKLVLQLVDDVMDYEKLRSGRFVLSPRVVDLWVVLEEVAEALRSGASVKGIEFHYAIDPSLPRWVRVDPLRLRQLVMNLGANAIKFTREGAVRISALRRSSSTGATLLEINVADTGPGISPDRLPHLFDAFVQGDEASGGTGLGLAITRDLSEAMGGSLSATSEPGVGSTFTARVGIDPARPASASRLSIQLRSVSLAPTRRGHVLVAEDDAFTQVILRRTLERLGHDVHIVADGVEALDACAARTFDAILMDCQMPRVDGYQATARLRELGGWGGGVPIIALTANAFEGDREKTLEAGMNDYVAKPFTLAELAAVLDRWMPSMPSRPAPAPALSLPPSPSEPPSSPVDPERLAVLAGGDQSFLADLGHLFTSDSQQRLDELDAALSRGDDGSRRQIAHVLAGAALNLGAGRFAALAREVEAADLGEAVRDHVATLRRELGRIRDQLSRETDEPRVT